MQVSLWECYLQVLHRLWSRIVRVRSKYPEGKQLFLLHDNVPPHMTKNANEFLMKKQICVIDHPPYIILIYHRVTIFCSQKWKLQWKELLTMTFQPFKQLRHRCYRTSRKPSLKSLWINWSIVSSVVLSLLDPILNKY